MAVRWTGWKKSVTRNIVLNKECFMQTRKLGGNSGVKNRDPMGTLSGKLKENGWPLARSAIQGETIMIRTRDRFA